MGGKGSRVKCKKVKSLGGECLFFISPDDNASSLPLETITCSIKTKGSRTFDDEK